MKNGVSSRYNSWFNLSGVDVIYIMLKGHIIYDNSVYSLYAFHRCSMCIDMDMYIETEQKIIAANIYDRA